MSEHKVSPGTMLLFIDPNGGTAYDTVICLKSVSITDSVASIDISSWCGPGKLPGLNDITLSFDGYHIQDNVSGSISGTDLRILLRNKTTIGWKLCPESIVIGDEIQSGQGFLDSLSSTYDFNNVGSFNFTIIVKGDINTVINNYTFFATFENDNSNYNPLLFYFGTDTTINISVNNIYEEYIKSSIEAPPFVGFAYACYITVDNPYSYYNVENITFNGIVNDPDSVIFVHSGSSIFGIPDYRLTNVNLSAFKNLKYIQLNNSKLSEIYCNNLLQQLIDNNVYNGSCVISEQYPSITLNSSLVAILESRGWTIS